MVIFLGEMVGMLAMVVVYVTCGNGVAEGEIMLSVDVLRLRFRI